MKVKSSGDGENRQPRVVRLDSSQQVGGVDRVESHRIITFLLHARFLFFFFFCPPPSSPAFFFLFPRDPLASYQPPIVRVKYCTCTSSFPFLILFFYFLLALLLLAFITRAFLWL